MKKQTLKPISFALNEWIGAFGDIGVLLPIFLSLVALNNLPPARSLLLIGILYTCSAYYFRLPIPVQPLKAMAAIALTQSLPVSLLAAGGIWIGIILVVLSITGKIDWLTNFFTKPIVRGIQLGVGLMLVKASGFLLFSHSTFPPHILSPAPSFSLPGFTQFISAFWLLALPQLPLTLGNAVFAVSDVANTYFGAEGKRAQPKSFALSLGIANIVIGLAGGLPACHGSGGLTAHYRFGARSGGATIIAGSICVLLALLFPQDIYKILTAIPLWALACMLCYVGICHALLIQDVKEKLSITLIMGLVGVVTSNLSFSLIVGLLMEWMYRKKALIA